MHPELLIIVVLASCAGLCFWHDYHTWNHGVCRESGLSWVPFDVDSQGGRGYKDAEGNRCWISWPVGDK